MLEKINLPPHAATLTESLRGMAYTLGTSVADIIDNSISAGAATVEIFTDRGSTESRVIIRDDGCGMTRDELIAAMALGSLSPSTVRRQDDLGRFGLGLKTASFSQCRKLTVISKKDGQLSAFSWDLDILAQEDDWSLSVVPLSDSDPKTDINTPSGTVVIWEKIDRISAFNPQSDRSVWSSALERLKKHLMLTFHRFMEDGDLTIILNRRPLRPWDPFFSEHVAKPKDFPECTWPVGALRPSVRMKSFVLPHPDQCQKSQNLFGPEDDLNLQGFFIYRGRRLISAGSWLGLRNFRAREAFKLARIRLDFENAGDADWRLDIKKSTARPPQEMREWLIKYATQARTISEQVLLAKKSSDSPEVTHASPLWRKKSRGRASFPDSSNPILHTAFELLEEKKLDSESLQGYFELLALSHPTAIKQTQSLVPTENISKLAFKIFESLNKNYDRKMAENIMRTTQPFSEWHSLLNTLLEM